MISHETIYRFVYAQPKRTNERRWRLYLPRSKYKRGRRNKGGGWPRIADRCSIHDRPHDIARQLGLQTFCDPHAPWQKGGIENAIGRLRRDLPRKTNLNTLPRSALDAIIARHNNAPRKCLRFQTPAEAFLNSLHFECESTPGTSPG